MELQVDMKMDEPTADITMESEAEEEVEELNKPSSSLFPIFHNSSTTTSSQLNPNQNPRAPQWLSNTSFTTDLSVINEAVSTHYSHLQSDLQAEEEEEQRDSATANEAKTKYQLVDSSMSDEDVEEKKRKRKRKSRKRYREAGASYDYAPSRKPDVRSWTKSTNISSSSTTKEYYFDSQGDRDNLAFGCIYRMDVARYKLYHSDKHSRLHNYSLYQRNQRSWAFDGDTDVNSLDSKLVSGGRYWSAKYTALERHKNFKRMRIVAPQKSAISIAPDFIPLSDDKAFGEGSDGGSLSRALVLEESWEDEVLRKTREFNKLTREHPHNESIWLAFADFQDNVASLQPQKGARLQTLEKKISILEKAAELNPDNEELLLGLMNAYQSRDSTEILIGRWEKILMEHSGSFKLWREFLHVVQGEFSRFKVSEMRKMYANAIKALSSVCTKQYRQVPQTVMSSSLDGAIVQQELGLVDIFVSLCRFEWQTGYQELATALFQAQIEYSLFCPSLLLTEQSKRRLFEYFWDSDGARVGEDGALGWSTWLEKEEEHRQNVINEESSDKIEEGGWTGWSEPLSESNDIGGNPENILDENAVVEDIDDESEARDIEQKDDTEALLKMLGISADVEADGEVKDSTTWIRWSEEELSRDSDQWMPVRANSGISNDGIADTEGDEQLLRVILFEDISEYIFSLSSEEARLSLVFQFIDFFGGRISEWVSTNSSSWVEKTLSLEALPDSMLSEIRRLHDVLKRTESSPSGSNLESISGGLDDISMRTNKMKFLRNAILLCLTACPHNHILEEATLVAEELSHTQMDSFSFSVTPCRTLAKSLLKSNRQDVQLCGVYARREAAFGNIDHARKVFDMALSSIEGLPLDSQSNASLLFFWYAEVELSNSSGGNSESSSRAMHILSCLGSGVKYSAFKCQPSSVQQLRARQGFKERIKAVRATWARGVTNDQSIALICSVALFEELTTGWVAGIEVLNQAFSMVLPERRSQSCQLEFLFNYYVRMLWKHHPQSKLSEVWDSIMQGLQIYPFSPKFYKAFVEISHLHTVPSKLRLIFDDYCRKKPSVVVWLYALTYEISRGSPHHRVHGLFERALASGRLHNSVILWRWYIAYEINVASSPSSAKRVFFRAIHACPWSKKLWLDGFIQLKSVLTAKELSDLQEVMRDKELNLRTDIYEILLQDEIEP
ncbi:hypothetical protein LguiA_009231 [Lonicera macranthoides]